MRFSVQKVDFAVTSFCFLVIIQHRDWTEGEMGLCERVVRAGVADLGPLNES